MLSVCVPLYNPESLQLIQDLSKQASGIEDAIEIMVLDDASSLPINTQIIVDLPQVSFHVNPTNYGRSKTRNVLAKMAQYDHILFIDGDSQIASNDFLNQWIQLIKQNSNTAIYGGSHYPKVKPGSDQHLRWTISVTRESLNLSDRKTKITAFKTSNVVLTKKILSDIQFDERLLGYGHEDTYFGMKMKDLNHSICHVDNSILNPHIDSNEVYLIKTEEAIRNIKRMVEFEGPKKVSEHLKLFSAYYKISKFGFQVFLKPIDWFCFGILKRSLLKGSGFLILWRYDLYKLILLHRTMKS